MSTPPPSATASHTPGAVAERGANPSAPGPWRDFRTVRRLFLADRSSGVAVLAVPWLLLGVVFCAIQLIFGGGTSASRAGAMVGMVVGFLFVIGVSAIVKMMPFALVIGSTRRRFFVGSLLAGGLTCLVWGAGTMLLGAAENATGGWGAGIRLFAWYGNFAMSWPMALLAEVAALLLVFLLGVGCGCVFHRWRSGGIVVLIVAVVAAVFFAGMAIDAWSSWPAVGDFFTRLGPGGITAGMFVAAAIVAVVDYAAARRLPM